MSAAQHRIAAAYYDEVGEFDRVLGEIGAPRLADWEYELLGAPPVVEAFPVTRRTRRGLLRAIGFRS